MTKMLGRDQVAKAEWLNLGGSTDWSDVPDEHKEIYTDQADRTITSYLAHMATLGWRMMPRKMTKIMGWRGSDAINASHPDQVGHIRHPTDMEILQSGHEAAYDHAPEPMEDE